MKKVLVLLLVCALCVTGCGKDDNTNKADNENTNKVSNKVESNKDKENEKKDDSVAKELVCKMSLADEMVQDVNVKFNSKDEALSVDTTITVDLTSSLAGETLTDEMRETLMETYETMFSEKNGYKNAKIDITGNIVKVKVDLFDTDDLDGLTGYKVAKSTFETAGYTCK